jgi:glycosyltransferase involved in cell wall biosynthesis
LKLVSAIITTHNRLPLLKKAIKSAQLQTYPEMEIIVVDDASDDETSGYMQSLVNCDLKYIRIEKKDSRGGNYARNIGIKNSAGYYIAFLDDDDEWLPDKISIQVSLIEHYTDVYIVYCGTLIEYNSNSNYRDIELPTIVLPTDCRKQILYDSLFCRTSCILMYRTLATKLNGFDESVKAWQEYEFLIRACSYSKIASVNKPLVIYRFSVLDIGSQISSKFDVWIRSVVYILHKHELAFKYQLNDGEKLICNKRILYESYIRSKMSNSPTSSRCARKLQDISLILFFKANISLLLNKYLPAKLFVKKILRIVELFKNK